MDGRSFATRRFASTRFARPKLLDRIDRRTRPILASLTTHERRGLRDLRAVGEQRDVVRRRRRTVVKHGGAGPGPNGRAMEGPPCPMDGALRAGVWPGVRHLLYWLG